MQGSRCGTPSQMSRITPWAEGGAKPLSHPGCPKNVLFFISFLCLLALRCLAQCYLEVVRAGMFAIFLGGKHLVLLLLNVMLALFVFCTCSLYVYFFRTRKFPPIVHLLNFFHEWILNVFNFFPYLNLCYCFQFVNMVSYIN